MSKTQINLPKTIFSMKANLPSKEPEIIEYWKKINLYDELRRESTLRNNISLYATENLKKCGPSKYVAPSTEIHFTLRQI